MIHFVGDSYAAVTLREGARRRGLHLTHSLRDANLIFISQDTPTDANGVRDLEWIRAQASQATNCATVVLTSQVPPGFCRSLPCYVYHQAETLRIEDGLQRSTYPEMFIVGTSTVEYELPPAYKEYLNAFDCPVVRMTWEEAEFAKIAINMTLAAQVDNANRLSAAAAKCGADWGRVSRALRLDSRIGKYSYLTPGRWQDSRHLLRDAVTLSEIEAR